MFDRRATKDPFLWARDAMVDEQLEPRGIRDARVLSAMREVPRHLFVPESRRPMAYEDRPLPIGRGQTISQPYMVARMVELLKLRATDRVLDVGTGSGYQAAVLSKLAGEVWSVEIVPELAEAARERLSTLGYGNVHVITGDGSLGLSEHAPYDAIVVAAGAADVPSPLVDQLAAGGRLVIPIGDLDSQTLRLVERAGANVTTESLFSCRFVPLVGREGWAPSPHGTG